MLNRLKSKTHLVAIAVTALGAVEMNAPQLMGMLGEWYGVSYVVLGVVIALLREMTTQPVSEKTKLF